MWDAEITHVNVFLEVWGTVVERGNVVGPWKTHETLENIRLVVGILVLYFSELKKFLEVRPRVRFSWHLILDRHLGILLRCNVAGLELSFPYCRHVLCVCVCYCCDLSCGVGVVKQLASVSGQAACLRRRLPYMDIVPELPVSRFREWCMDAFASFTQRITCTVIGLLLWRTQRVANGIEARQELNETQRKTKSNAYFLPSTEIYSSKSTDSSWKMLLE